MLTQSGESNWNDGYIKILKILLVCFEGLDDNQLSFFTDIENYTLSKILVGLKPFIVVEIIVRNASKSLRYKLYHQSLAEFLKTNSLEDGSKNTFAINELESHSIIIKKYYDDDSFNTISIDFLDGYALRYLPDHLYALVSYRDPKKINWYLKLLHLAKNNEFEKKQLEYFPFETDLQLKTIKRAFEASLIKEDPVSTADLLLLHSSKVIRIFIESPLSILKGLYKVYTDFDNSENNYALENVLRHADLYNKEIRILWYLLIAWFLDCKKDRTSAKKTLDTLFKKELIHITNGHIVIPLIYYLHGRYKLEISNIFDYLSNDDIYRVCSPFVKNRNKLKDAYEIFRYIKDKKSKINNLAADISINEYDIEGSIITEFISMCDYLSDYLKPQALSSIAQSMAQSGKMDESAMLFDKALEAANTLSDYSSRSQFLSSIFKFLSSMAQSGKIDESARLFDKALEAANTLSDSYKPQALSSISQALSSLAQSMAQSGKMDESAMLFDKAIAVTNTISTGSSRSISLSSIAQSLAQSGKIDEAIDIANALSDSYLKPQSLSSIAQSLAQSGKMDESAMLFDKAIEAADLWDDYSRSLALSSIAQSLAQSGKMDESAMLFDKSMEAANLIPERNDFFEARVSIAQSMAQSGKIDEAIDIANALSDNTYKPQALSSIAQSLAQSGKIDEALDIANTLYGSPRSEALSSIASSLAESRNIPKAIIIVNEIGDNKNRSKILLEIILIQLKLGKSLSKDLLGLITPDITNSLYKIVLNSLNSSKGLWDYLMNQCIGYPEISYSICALITKRYPEKAGEIAKLVLKYTF
jgi:lipopolysaccharide biosynthesis regulator YciM